MLPKDYGVIDILALHSNQPGVFLHSALDVIPRQPVIEEDGSYILNYKVYSESFPLLTFSLRTRVLTFSTQSDRMEEFDQSKSDISISLVIH